jgi:hypothetical protein
MSAPSAPPLHDPCAGWEVRLPNPCSASAHYEGRAPIPAFLVASYAFQEQKRPGLAEILAPGRKSRPRSSLADLGAARAQKSATQSLSGYSPSVPAADREPSARSCVAWQTAVRPEPSFAKAVLDSLRRTHDDSPLSVSFARGSRLSRLLTTWEAAA